MKSITFCALLGAATVVMTGHGKDKEDAKQVVRAETAAQFDAMAAAVRKEMQQGGRYEYATPAEKADVDKELDQMAGLLKTAGSVSAMSDNERIALFNIQEKVNGTLTHTDSERLICEKVSPVGSHIPITTCKTYAQIAQSRQDTRRFLEGKESNVHQRTDPSLLGRGPASSAIQGSGAQ